MIENANSVNKWQQAEIANNSDYVPYAALHYDTTQCIAPFLALTTGFSIPFYGLEVKTEGHKPHKAKIQKAAMDRHWIGLDWAEFNAPPDTVYVPSEAVFTANHLTVTDKQ